MLQIRKGVFETNSSSSHAIVVGKKDSMASLEDAKWRLDDNGMIEFYEGDLEFGWGFDILINWYDRLRYAVASCADMCDDDTLDRISSLCEKRIPGCKGLDLSEVKGVIDHQSMGLFQEALSKISLEDFIFNDRYAVIIDNDNSALFTQIMACPFYSADNVQEIIE